MIREANVAKVQRIVLTTTRLLSVLSTTSASAAMKGTTAKRLRAKSLVLVKCILPVFKRLDQDLEKISEMEFGLQRNDRSWLMLSCSQETKAGSTPSRKSDDLGKEKKALETERRPGRKESWKKCQGSSSLSSKCHLLHIRIILRYAWIVSISMNSHPGRSNASTIWDWAMRSSYEVKSQRLPT